MVESRGTVVSPLFGEVAIAADEREPGRADDFGTHLLRAAEDAEQRQEAPPPAEDVDNAEEELERYAAFTDAVRATVKEHPERHGRDVDTIARSALTAGCNTLTEFHDWFAHQHMNAARSGFHPPDTRHFPEPEIVQLAEYLRYADKERAQL